ncbi:hypothetical protein SMETP3_46650 (plasmid) [Serratia marcescens]|uniref:helix-turn-helix transcriptional regulator n=1 Tax=Serratia TaxID=613 RepID=UPI001560AFCC|nr:LuxR C-terminal-related transcriptional regulator [Serratia marcescens]MBH2524362.1 hypothetical protein [Serratia marcescens]MBH2567096.1 hypothetical protein [Serratia marcescens]MBH2894919.1 hypothetical protein [Serratia marcescens]MBH2909108.1 hypothetical protein [Serratia marcescens]MBH2913698.1 hypothetical protein [Serratia marcescens]
MRKVAVYSYCSFALQGMVGIAHESKLIVHLLLENDSLIPYPYFNKNIELDDVFVHVRPGITGDLKLIKKIMTSGSSSRVIAMVDNTVSVPILKLLRAMGVTFIFSLRDSLMNLGNFLQDSSSSYYVSEELQESFKTIKAPSSRPSKWDLFDGVQYLTPMETEIILDLIQGISPWRVARNRFVSLKTVSTHKLNALRKMELRGLNEFFITPQR